MSDAGSRAQAAGDRILAMMRQAQIGGFDAVPALAAALGSLIAEQCYPDQPHLTIIGSGAIIGAAARCRHDQIAATGAAMAGVA